MPTSAAVRGYAADALGCSADRVVDVTRFDTGNRHAVFRVTYLEASRHQRGAVVRVSHGADSQARRQAALEAKVLEIADGVAAPALYDFQPAGPWFESPAMCIQFIPGRPRELASASATDLGRLGSALRQVHRRPTGDFGEWAPLATDVVAYAEDRLQSILSGVVWVRDPLPAGLQTRLRDAAAALERRLGAWPQTPALTTAEPLVLLHGDPAAGNILWAPEPVLIDWEYARLGDPADEIAYLFDQNELGPPQREAFWVGYNDSAGGGEPDFALAERARWWEPVTLLGSTLWWVERWVRRADSDVAGGDDADAAREPAYYLERILRRVERLDRLLAR